jgi:hypothetical protein
VAVGERLKVGKVFAGVVLALPVEGGAFVDLLRHRFFRIAVGGGEGAVIAKGASAVGYGAVAVRATEACVDGDFLHALPEDFF